LARILLLFSGILATCVEVRLVVGAQKLAAKRRLHLAIAGFTVAIFAFATFSPVAAGTLHSFCGTPTANTCPDTGSIAPTSQNPPSFGFLFDPAPQSPAGGNFFLEVLLPNNDVLDPSTVSFDITGTHTGNADVLSSLVSTTAWTNSSVHLAAYLNAANATPQPIDNPGGDNPLSSFLTDPTPSTQNLDPGATGYYVYQFAFGNVAFSATTDPTFSTLFNVPAGSVIVAFYEQAFVYCKVKPKKGQSCPPVDVANYYAWTKTPSSQAIIETAGNGTEGNCLPGTVCTPEPITLSLFGAGLAGAAVLRRRRKMRA
jgi:hypothetical protein